MDPASPNTAEQGQVPCPPSSHSSQSARPVDGANGSGFGSQGVNVGQMPTSASCGFGPCGNLAGLQQGFRNFGTNQPQPCYVSPDLCWSDAYVTVWTLSWSKP